MKPFAKEDYCFYPIKSLIAISCYEKCTSKPVCPVCVCMCPCVHLSGGSLFLALAFLLAILPENKIAPHPVINTMQHFDQAGMMYFLSFYHNKPSWEFKQPNTYYTNM